MIAALMRSVPSGSDPLYVQTSVACGASTCGSVTGQTTFMGMSPPGSLTSSATNSIVALTFSGFVIVIVPETAQPESVKPVLVTSTVYWDVPLAPVVRFHVLGVTDLLMSQAKVRVNDGDAVFVITSDGW